jgi:hypothetical protein
MKRDEKRKRVSVHNLIEEKKKTIVFCYDSIKTEEDKKERQRLRTYKFTYRSKRFNRQ